MNQHILIVQCGGDTSRRLAERLVAEAELGQIRAQIMAAATFDAAEQHLRAWRYDLVVAPLSLDNRGVALAQDLREISPDSRLLLVADATATDFQRQIVRRLGAHVAEGGAGAAALGERAVAVLRGAEEATARVAPEPAARLRAPAAAQQAQLAECLAALGREPGSAMALLADIDGREIAAWRREPAADSAALGAAAARCLLASAELGVALGAGRPGDLIVVEYGDRLVLACSVGRACVLALVAEAAIPLGWARMALRRAADGVQMILRGEAAAPLAAEPRVYGWASSYR